MSFQPSLFCLRSNNVLASRDREDCDQLEKGWSVTCCRVSVCMLSFYDDEADASAGMCFAAERTQSTCWCVADVAVTVVVVVVVAIVVVLFLCC